MSEPKTKLGRLINARRKPLSKERIAQITAEVLAEEVECRHHAYRIEKVDREDRPVCVYCREVKEL